MNRKKKIPEEFEKSTLSYFSDIGNFSPLSRDEELSLWERYKKNNDIQARDKIIKSNLKFVASVAKPYQGLGLSYSDLIAEGNLGLMKAIDRFDYEKGFRTISYSVWWIRQAILEALDERNLLKGDELPVNKETATEREDDASNHNGTQTEMEDSDYINYLKDKEMKSAVRVLMKCLTEREQFILTKYFGLDAEEEMTLEEIGKKIGLTKERVRQIKEKALKKLRAEALKNSISVDIYN